MLKVNVNYHFKDFHVCNHISNNIHNHIILFSQDKSQNVTELPLNYIIIFSNIMQHKITGIFYNVIKFKIVIRTIFF